MVEKIKKLINSKFYRYLDWLVFIVLLLACSYVMAILFYNQANSDGNTYMSDVGPYIQEMLGTNDKYDFPYPVLFKFAWVINLFSVSPEWAMTIALAVLNTIAIIITKIVFTAQTGSRLLATGCSICLFFLTMIFGKSFVSLGIPNFYIGVFSPNPWQNGTYLAARPFSIVAFVLGIYCLENYENDFSNNDNKSGNKFLLKYVLFSISLLLVTMAKPSYTIVHLGAAGLVMLYRFIKTRMNNFKESILYGLFFVPTLVALLYQYSGVFVGTTDYGQEQGVGIAPFRVWSMYVDNYLLAWILAGAFPFVVLLFHLGKIKTDFSMRFSWLIYLVGLVMAILLYEKGFRERDFNFSWGYICGLFVVFFNSIEILLKDTMAIIDEKKKISYIVMLTIQWGFLAIHTFMGLEYFTRLWYGWNYI